MKLRKTSNKSIVKKVMEFKPYDYAFMLYIESECLKKYIKYFETSDIAVEDVFNASRIKLALKLLTLYLDSDDGYNLETGKCTYYTNIKNSNRFCKYKVNTPLEESGLRLEKIWHLYCLIREKDLRNWWN